MNIDIDNSKEELTMYEEIKQEITNLFEINNVSNNEYYRKKQIKVRRIQKSFQ